MWWQTHPAFREDGEGAVVGNSSCEGCCTSCGVLLLLQCLSHPGTMDQKTLGTFSSIWPRRALGKEIARILCPTHNVWDTWPSARKSEAIWVSHFNHQLLLSCLPPPLLAKVQICQASFIPKYFLYFWRIAKICGLLPALWVSTLSHGCLFSLNIIQKHRHEQKQVCSSLPWKPAWEVNNRREYRSPWA